MKFYGEEEALYTRKITVDNTYPELDEYFQNLFTVLNDLDSKHLGRR